MQENKLLASVVLFRELYDRDKDIYDVIGELLKAAIIFEKKWAFNTTEATELLNTTFGFKIPEAVVKTTLRNRLKNQEKVLLFNQGIYSIVLEKIKDTNLLSSELDSTKSKQSEIIDDLILYIENRSLETIDELKKSDIVDSFCAYLLDDDVSKTYSNFISSYIIERQSSVGLTDSLNAVREGFVLYNGVRYSSDLNELGSWKTELAIYLDTEHLFNAVGYNGVLYKQLFDDFYGLIMEINRGGRKLITLKYFVECDTEVENFFHMAERIIEGKVNLDPSKTAMRTILNGSKVKSDILANKAYFYSQLKNKNITLETRTNFYDEPKYNIENASLVGKLKAYTEDSGWPYDKEKCLNILKTFTKINVLRRGVNSGAFEKIGNILMSGNSFTHFLAFNRLVKPYDKDIPFATSIDFITNRLWFKLERGLTHPTSLPKSMDVVAKAQVVLSSQINSSVSDKFDSMKRKFSDGKITKVEMEYLNHELRSKATTPENITPENVESTLEFLNLEDFESHLREKSILEKKAANGEKAIRELADIQRQESKIEKERIILKAKIQVGLLLLALIVFILCCYGLVFYLIYSMSSNTDSTLAIIGIMLSFIVGTAPIYKYKKIKSLFENRYHELVSKL